MKTKNLALLLSCLLILPGAAGAASAGTLFVDFGTTDGTNISPFTTDYTPMPASGGTSPDHYYVAKCGYGYTWSSFDWGGFDHTTADHSGDFMVVDGSNNSGHAIVSYALSNAVAGQEYTFSGYAQQVQGQDGGNATLSFQVNGVEQGTFAIPQGSYPEGYEPRVWYQFSFTYTPADDGLVTFALHDNNVNTSYNDFGLDDLTLTGPNVVPVPPAALLLGSGLLGLAGWGWRSRKRWTVRS